jgi:hypothetical protein
MSRNALEFMFFCLWKEGKMENHSPIRSRFSQEYRTPGNDEEISLLLNSVYFLLENALIVSKDNQYRLLVRHKEKVLVDEWYSTLRGARIAFARRFSQKFFDKENGSAQWSPLYQPEKRWLDSRLPF